MCIWPEHCLIGSPGHCVVPVLNAALQQWAGNKMRTVNYIMKGTNCMTEMYVHAPPIHPLNTLYIPSVHPTQTPLDSETPLHGTLPLTLHGRYSCPATV
jgi:nicotinamidase-related amidase